VDWAEGQKQLRAQKRIARLIAILGALFLSIATWQAVETIAELQRGLTARGTVVGLEKTGQGKRRHDFPRVEFRDRAGKTHQFTDWDSEFYDVGNVVNVVYDPSRPTYASIDSPYENWKLPVVLGSLGAMFLLISLHRLRRRT
jgi:hypothetical protein